MNIRIILLLLTASLGFAACKKDKGTAPAEDLNEMVDTAAVLKYSGSFIDGPSGSVYGLAKIYRQVDGKYILKLEDFKSTNGPNLHVFLSQEEFPKTYTDLGPLKSLKGNQVYEISVNFEPKPYSFVCIHCVDYNHLFGSAAF